MAATESMSGRHRPLADGVLRAFGLGCRRDPESLPGVARHERALPLIIDPCPDKYAASKRLRWRLLLREAPGEEEVSSNLSAREP